MPKTVWKNMRVNRHWRQGGIIQEEGRIILVRADIDGGMHIFRLPCPWILRQGMRVTRRRIQRGVCTCGCT